MWCFFWFLYIVCCCIFKEIVIDLLMKIMFYGDIVVKYIFEYRYGDLVNM